MAKQVQKGNPMDDFSLRETKPRIGGGRVSSGDGLATAFNLVEQMHYLYVRVVKAKDLLVKGGGGVKGKGKSSGGKGNNNGGGGVKGSNNGGSDVKGSSSGGGGGGDVKGSNDGVKGSGDGGSGGGGALCVDLQLGNCKASTHQTENKATPEWNLVFAFPKERIQASKMEVFVKDKGEIMGRILFELNEVPRRVPPDSPLAPQWYRLENQNGERVGGELMLAVWSGTQADEAFPDARLVDNSVVDGVGVGSIKSKVYLSPRLWYLRVNVVEAQDLVPSNKTRIPDVYVKATLGGSPPVQTRISHNQGTSPMWNEDLMLVAAEPFDEPLIVSVIDNLGLGKEEVLGRCAINLHTVDKRLDSKPVGSKWYILEKNGVVDGNNKKKDSKCPSRIHLRVSLDGGYHVLDESSNYSSDLNPTARQLWKPSIGAFELGILNSTGLLPMKSRDGRATTDAYCVAKYGQKWVRTKTVMDSLAPKWNEQYTWEVFDPCTVVTIGVFDNCHLQVSDKAAKETTDSIIGKVRIRLSTIDTNRVYTYSYPLLVLHPSGVKRMGEIQLAFRFSTASFANTMLVYQTPLLPKMHYIHPLTIYQINSLRTQAIQLVSMRLSRSEPPLRKEVVEYMLDVGSHLWSFRRSKSNFYRIVSVLSGLTSFCKTFGEVCRWKNPVTTVLYHILYAILVIFPDLILPLIFLYCFLMGIWNLRRKPKDPIHVDIKLSCADRAFLDELEEEFDTYPTSKSADVVKQRYDRLRSMSSRLQSVMGDIAGQGERVQALLNWRDPRASTIFVLFCFIASIVMFVTPPKVVMLLAGFYVMRHPNIGRDGLPSAPMNFFRRLPARTESLL